MAKTRARTGFTPKLISVAVAACFATSAAFANPTGPAVVNGTASFQQTANLLQITNSPNAIINWQSFSIGASEITRFLQQSASSAVLNRVIAQNPSSILGALQSNGRVFLINPNGILFGAGAQIDVAGLVASTLNLSNADFLAGKLKFTEVPGAGSVINQGNITAAAGGQVYLVGPSVTNSGVITTQKGEVILAAGNSVELVNPGTPNLRVEISAPDNQAVNLGQIVADSGRVGIYAGLINHAGTIRADSAVATEDGRIVLAATKNVTLDAGSITSASGTVNGAGGGTVAIEGQTITNAGTVLANAADNATAGSISMVAQNSLTLDSTSRVEAKGADINSTAGTVYFYSYGDAVARNGQVIDISGGAQSGDGGSGEFSAARNVTFGGTILGNAAPGYQKGSFVMDPLTATASGTFAANTTIFAEDNIEINGNVNINSGFTLTLLADHETGVPGNWDVSGGEGGTVGVGSITRSSAFMITGADNTTTLVMFAGGGGVGTAVQPILTNMNGASITVNTTNPSQVGAADTFITNGASPINIAGFNDGANSNNFKLITGGAVTQTAPVTVSGLAVAANGAVNLPLANSVGTLAGSAVGSFIFNNAQSLTIGSVAAINGITVVGASPATIDINVTGGDLTVNNNINATATGSSNAATITLSSSGGITVKSLVEAKGGFGNNGGKAEIKMTAGAGGITIQGPSGFGSCSDAGGGVFACGGNGQTGGQAIITLNTTGGITVDNSRIEAVGGNGGSGAVGGNATVTLASTGGLIEVKNSSNVNAFGGGGGGGTSPGGAGGNATVTLTNTNGSITVQNSTLRAFAGGGGGGGSGGSAGSPASVAGAGGGGSGGSSQFPGGAGGKATATLSAGGNISLTSSTINVRGGGGGGGGSSADTGGAGGNGGTATATLSAGGNISLTSSSINVGAGGGGGGGFGSSTGGNGGNGGAATAMLTAGGSIGLSSTSSINVGGGGGGGGGGGSPSGGAGGVGIGGVGGSGGSGSATRGGDGGSGGTATATLSAGGNISLTSSSINVGGGGGGEGGSGSIGGNGGIGGNAFVALTTGGNITLGSSVNADGGSGSPDGVGRIDLIFLSPSGTYSVNGVTGADPPAMGSDGFFVNSPAPAIPGVNFFVTRPGAAPPTFTFIDQVVVANNLNIDILADQLSGAEAGEGAPEEKKKELPVCR